MRLRERPRIALGHFPTRLVHWPRLGASIGVDLWIKHEFEADAFGAGNKVRKLEFLFASVLDGGYSGLVLDGSTQSNCAMALALYAPRVGFTVDLILYGDTSRGGNYVDILRSSADVTLLPEWSPDDIAAARAKIAARRGDGRLYDVPTGATNEITTFASIELADELARQEDELGASIDHVVFPTGTGGTQAGLEIGRTLCGKPWALVGVATANDAEFFRQVTNSLFRHPLLAPVLRSTRTDLRPRTHVGAIGRGYGIPLEGTFEAIASLRRRFGLILDSVYTYKTFVGLRQLVDAGTIERGSTVVFLHTGGVNERFLDAERSS